MRGRSSAGIGREREREDAQHEDVPICERGARNKSVLRCYTRRLLLDLLSQLHAGLLEASLLRAGVRVGIRRTKGRKVTTVGKQRCIVLEPSAVEGGRVVLLLLLRLERCGWPGVMVVVRRVSLVLVRRRVVNVVVVLRKRMVVVVLRGLLRLGRKTSNWSVDWFRERISLGVLHLRALSSPNTHPLVLCTKCSASSSSSSSSLNLVVRGGKWKLVNQSRASKTPRVESSPDLLFPSSFLHP